jgi:soluble lytic murein transglycosylase
MYIKELIILVILILFICILFNFENKFKLLSGIFYENPYESYITKYSNHFSVDPLIVKAVMKKESNLARDVVSSKGAVGLMQIMPKTALEIAKQLNVKNYSGARLKESEINIMFGTYYLQRLLNYYDNNLILALAAYNAGMGNVKNWCSKNRMIKEKINEIPFKETRDYVQYVMLHYKLGKFLHAFKKGLDCIKNINLNQVCEINIISS